MASVGARQQHPRTIYSKQRTNAIEFAREDFENDECEGELRKRSADIRAFKGALCGADLDELLGGKDDRAGTVEA
jgi:hypothetical protein